MVSWRMVALLLLADGVGLQADPLGPPPTADRQTLAGVGLGAALADARKALGAPTWVEEGVATWARPLWSAPDPDSDQAPPLTVQAWLRVEHEEGAVRSVVLAVEVGERERAALALQGELAVDPTWATPAGVALGMALDGVEKRLGVPYVVVGREAGTPPEEMPPLDDGVMDLRYRTAENEWLFVLLTDMDPRPGEVDLRVTHLRIAPALTR